MKHRAFALPLVLWSVAFLTVISLGMVGAVGRWLDDETFAERRFAARLNALSGVAVGRSPSVEAGDSLLQTGDSEHDGHDVRLSDESGRINPNRWLATGDREIFERLFTFWKAGMHERDAAIDGMTDWVDEDGFAALNGAESGFYAAQGMPDLPPNGPFASVREMGSVRGLDVLLSAQAGWRDVFSVWNEGKVSALHAPAALLEALAGFSAAQAETFTTLRSGADGISGTEDDQKFASLEEVATLAGANGEQAALLEKFFDLGSGLPRIESTGWANGASFRVTVIVAGDKADGKFLHWEEQ